MSDQIAIKVESVSKDFILPHQKANSLKSLFTGSYKKNTKKASETQHALKDISFEVKEGEFFGIVGRNGSGKSTLLKILADIYQPTEGKVSIKGKLIPFIELGVGFNPELTGRENVYLNGALLGFSTDEVTQKYKDIVDFSELDRFMDQKLKNYSSGMQVRLAFSVATKLAESDILLIDEVLAVGDAAFQRKCFDFFRSLKKQGTTVVFVSHDMEAIKRFCDRTIMIEKNRLVSNDKDSVEKVADQYTKMFLEETKKSVSVSKTTNSKRWGDGKVYISSAKISGTNYDADEILIDTVIKCKEKVSAIKAGFIIKNFSGALLFGSNNVREKLSIEVGQSGKLYRLLWKIPRVFNEGEYFIDLAVSYDDGEIGDRWQDALSFKIFIESPTPYVIDPKVKLEIHEK